MEEVGSLKRVVFDPSKRPHTQTPMKGRCLRKTVKLTRLPSHLANPQQICSVPAALERNANMFMQRCSFFQKDFANKPWSGIGRLRKRRKAGRRRGKAAKKVLTILPW